MVIKVDKCNECPLLNRSYNEEYSMWDYECNHPNNWSSYIKETAIEEMHPSCPLRDECISIRIK